MKRAPLNPCDYFLLMLDEAMRREGLPGNMCQAVLTMKDPPSLEELRAWAAGMLCSHPWLAATLQFSPILRRPRWGCLTKATIPVAEAADAEAVINAPMDPRRDVPFQVFRTREGVIFRWHHSLMDAKGCEDLLSGRTSPVEKGREYAPDLSRHSWWRRVRMSFGARKMLRAIDDLRPANFDHRPREGSKTFGVRRDTFSSQETADILARAGLQKNLYFLSSVLGGLNDVVTEEGPLVIPLPTSLRKKEWAPVIANYLTFFHFVVERSIAGKLGELKKVHLEQIRRQEDAAMITLLHLGRRLSLSRYLRERVSREGRERVTVYFSYTGDAGVTEFLGKPVQEYRSFPGVPARPGVGVFLGESRGRLLLTTVFVRENVEQARVDDLVGRLREAL